MTPDPHTAVVASIKAMLRATAPNKASLPKEERLVTVRHWAWQAFANTAAADRMGTDSSRALAAMLSATPFGEVDLARIDLARVAAIAALANVPDPTPTLPHGLSSAQHTLAAAHHAHECAVAAGFGAALAREPDLTAREWARRHEGGKVMP